MSDDAKMKDLEGDEARFENEEEDVEGHAAGAPKFAAAGEPKFANDEDDDVEAHAKFEPKFKPKF
jgi:hypothetical protein